MLGRLRLDVVRLVRELSAGRMHGLAGRVERRRHGVLREPFDLDVRVQPTQLAGDGDVAPRVAEPDRRRQVERALRPPAPARPARRRGRRRGEVAQQEVDADGIARVRAVPGALHRNERPAGHVRELLADDRGPDRVVGAVDDEHGTRNAPAQARELVAVVQLPPEVCQGQGLGRGLEAPAHAVLDLLGRVRLGEHLAEEELQEVAVVLEPVVAVVLAPAVVGLLRLVERLAGAREVLGERRGRPDERRALHALRMLGSEQYAPEHAGRQPDEDGALSARGIHHRQGVGRELALGVCLDRRGTVGAAIPAPIERDHPGVTGEVVDLRLPVARVDDRPGGEQQDRRLAVAVDLVEQAHAVALDVALIIRVAGACLLARGGNRIHGRHRESFLCSQSSIHWSRSACPVSMPDRRSKMMPSFNVITSETRASRGMGIP